MLRICLCYMSRRIGQGHSVVTKREFFCVCASTSGRSPAFLGQIGLSANLCRSLFLKLKLGAVVQRPTLASLPASLSHQTRIDSSDSSWTSALILLPHPHLHHSHHLCDHGHSKALGARRRLRLKSRLH